MTNYRTEAECIKAAGKGLAAVFAVYALLYFVTTSVHHGEMGDDRFDLRMFRSSFHQGAFLPLLKLEEAMKTDKEANLYFCGHVANGASLPPARNDIHTKENGDRKSVP